MPEVVPHFPVHAWKPAIRLLAAGAQVMSTVNLLFFIYIFAFDTVTGEGLVTPQGAAIQLVGFSLLPTFLTWLLRRSSKATLEVGPEFLVLTLREERFEVPRESIASVHPWRLPLPGAGVVLRMKSGRLFTHHLEVPSPLPLLAALGEVPPTAASAAQHPHSCFGQARYEGRSKYWDSVALKFGLFPLIPTGIMFRAHQYITFGGPFGQYRMFGLTSYLKTFAGYWILFTTSLVLYACFWRILSEVLAFALTWLIPSRARGVRQSMEWFCRLVYYVGIPAILALRFLS